MGIVTCGGCKIKFDRVNNEAEFIKGKWYHQGCAEIKRDKMVLDEYICKLFGLKSPGPTNNILIKKYREERGYNYKGMYNALKYFYEVKKHSIDKSEERVGIIPFVYSEAEEYFINFERMNRPSNRKINNNEKEEINILMCKPQSKDNQEINTTELDSLFEE